jgi:hypothetical protein
MINLRLLDDGASIMVRPIRAYLDRINLSASGDASTATLAGNGYRPDRNPHDPSVWNYSGNAVRLGEMSL